MADRTDVEAVVKSFLRLPDGALLAGERMRMDALLDIIREQRAVAFREAADWIDAWGAHESDGLRGVAANIERLGRGAFNGLPRPERFQ